MKTYAFDPLSSITVYELAQILKACKLLISEEAFAEMPRPLRAHFQELSEVADDNRDDYHGA